MRLSCSRFWVYRPRRDRPVDTLVFYIGDVHPAVGNDADAIAEACGRPPQPERQPLRGLGKVGAGGYGHPVQHAVAHGGVVNIRAGWIHVDAVDTGHQVRKPAKNASFGWRNRNIALAGDGRMPIQQAAVCCFFHQTPPGKAFAEETDIGNKDELSVGRDAQVVEKDPNSATSRENL